MQTLSDAQISDFTAKLIPLTYFCRNSGKVLKKLHEAGSFILTKNGKPVALLSAIKLPYTKREICKV